MSNNLSRNFQTQPWQGCKLFGRSKVEIKNFWYSCVTSICGTSRLPFGHYDLLTIDNATREIETGGVSQNQRATGQFKNFSDPRVSINFKHAWAFHHS